MAKLRNGYEGGDYGDFEANLPKTKAPDDPADPANPEAPAAAGAAPTDYSKYTINQWQDPKSIEAYYASRGVTPNAGAGGQPGSADYWSGKAKEPWAVKDPAFFYKYLSNAEEFSGGRQQTANAMGYGGGAGAGGGVGGDPYQTDPAMHDAIAQLLAEGNTPVTQADVQSQYQPVANTMERGALTARMASAQRRAVEGTGAQGGGGGANDADVNSINEDMAGKQGNLMAQLMGDEIGARRQKVSQALNYAQGEERMGLQKQLADMDAQLRRLGINNQNQQFYDDFTYRAGRDTANDDTLSKILQLLG